jgi:hypothetical protein
VADIHIGTSSFDELVEAGPEQIVVLAIERQIKLIVAELGACRR